ncbi:hypothetical protein TetV_330 [Tetraselmis virus 1]|uniref:Uncharacterized protein n=1 Tax=Tetraselmis virus 1 TaxID=2060617 RepID=A0A2P0VNE7_9VIRU|nr:hypothetical protein QJ968_gp330 [Tetraselmis virus 1]AUF82422.1 hypothetical protein TetV_330 [Tetraselmis virus 1]
MRPPKLRKVRNLGFFNNVKHLKDVSLLSVKNPPLITFGGVCWFHKPDTREDATLEEQEMNLNRIQMRISISEERAEQFLKLEERAIENMQRKIMTKRLEKKTIENKWNSVVKHSYDCWQNKLYFISINDEKLPTNIKNMAEEGIQPYKVKIRMYPKLLYKAHESNRCGLSWTYEVLKVWKVEHMNTEMNKN